jgi:hypothetical protein
VRTDEQRRKHRDVVRRIRREKEFREFCRIAGLTLSPQSSLNPELWPGWMNRMAETRAERNAGYRIAYE